jgi:hypothetical protein
LLQFWQLLKLLQKAQLAILHNWHTPLLNEYPVRQPVHVETATGQEAQLGTEHATQPPLLNW